MSEIYQKFKYRRVVRRKEVLEYFSGNAEKTNAALRWLTKSGKAQRIKVGLYYLKNPDEWFTDEVLLSPWLIASQAWQPGVIGYHSALRLLCGVHSETKNFQIVVSKNETRAPKSFNYQGVHYQFYRDDLSFGINYGVADNIKIKAFDKERLVLEGLMQPDKFYGMAEFLQSVEDIKWLDLDHLLEMLTKYPLPTVSMRLGWLLEKFKDKWYVENTLLKKLKQNRPQDRVFLINKNRIGNLLAAEWNLMAPKTILALEE